MNIPQGTKFSTDHEWVTVDGNIATIGISDFAQSELGDIVFVDIDSDIAELVFGETFGSIEAVKTVSDLYAPLSGKVIEINAALEDEPELVNSDPYGDGWLIKIECSDLSQLDSLLSIEDYKKQIGE
ncbi:MAG: glycine cleavage system protein GcvH [Bacteroidetes bacterium]|nr:glycine cleavage system protein GcvH [Bacteroidota bacterium]MBU1115482.1 glycine cleavage system protein GcvH [Bacteroidota bacterium]MBU1798159.1 glycine cleavage system protein GcvH [Bacteroidota bacterium]